MATVVVGDRPTYERDPVIFLGDNTAAAAWMNRWGGARDPSGGAQIMRLLGIFVIREEWGHREYHIAGIDTVLADGFLDITVAISVPNYSPLLRLHSGRRNVWAS